MPSDFELDLHAPLRGAAIFIRRTTDSGSVTVLGRQFAVDPHWIRRLLRCEVDFTNSRIQFYALRRRDPHDQPLLHETTYFRHDRPFKGKPQLFSER